MRLFNFKKEKAEQLTVEKVKDFFRYSEVAKFKGQSTGEGSFGSKIEIDYARENSEYLYEGIWLFGDEKWAHISIENEDVRFRYVKTNYMPLIADCPITTNEKEISLITKILLGWYRKLKLPNSISEIQKRIDNDIPNADNTIEQKIEVEDFGGTKPSLTLRKGGNGYLIVECPPFYDGDGNEIDGDDDFPEVMEFEDLISEYIGVPVKREDREVFLIEKADIATLRKVKEFIENYWTLRKEKYKKQ